MHGHVHTMSCHAYATCIPCHIMCVPHARLAICIPLHAMHVPHASHATSCVYHMHVLPYAYRVMPSPPALTSRPCLPPCYATSPLSCTHMHVKASCDPRLSHTCSLPALASRPCRAAPRRYAYRARPRVCRMHTLPYAYRFMPCMCRMHPMPHHVCTTRAVV